MSAKNKKCVGIIFGGKSNEHDVSIKSAKSIYKALKSNKDKYTIKPFYINKNGCWFSSEKSLLILKSLSNIKEVNTEFSDLNFLRKIDCSDVDIWFPILHGLNGEDGTIQGLLKLTQKPFICSGIIGSALGMDKILTKLILSNLNIPQVNYFPIQNFDLTIENNLQKTCDQICDKLNFPLFIKPSNSGSSIGISKVNTRSEIPDALRKAWTIDHRIIVEEGLKVRELECGVIGKKCLLASNVGEVEYLTDWYDYESKYETNNKLIIPAEIDEDIKKKIQTLSLKSCRALNIHTYARIDFFLEKESNKIFLNEINTIPGFTNKSMFPLLWKSSGIEIDQLVAKLIDISSENFF